MLEFRAARTCICASFWFTLLCTDQSPLGARHGGTAKPVYLCARAAQNSDADGRQGARSASHRVMQA